MTTETTIPSRDSLAGTTLAGRYRLTRLIGSGGMADVYEGVHTWTERRVAVKVLRTGRGGASDGVFTPEPATLERFLAEARAASRTKHPRVVEVLDMGRDPASGVVFMAQELLDGENLRAYLRRRGRLPAEEALALLGPLLAALAAAHDAGVIHRDVKPENIFVEARPDGPFARLIDFGIARIHEADAARVGVTRTGAVVGTAGYMAPEQARGEPALDARADIWAMGVVLYEALTGSAPFVGPNYNDVIAQVLTRRAPPLREVAPEVPPAVADAIDRSLEPDRARRHPTMQAFAAALLPPRRDSLPAVEAAAPPRTAPRRVAALAGLALAAAALGSAYVARRPPPPSAARPAPPPAARPSRLDPPPAAPLAVAGLVALAPPALAPPALAPPRPSRAPGVAIRRRAPPRSAPPATTTAAPRNGAVLIPP